MALAIETLSLASATLSGGAALLAAGGGLPQRVSGEKPITIGTPFVNGTTADLISASGYHSFAVKNNGDVLHVEYASGRLRRFSGTTGLQVAEVVLVGSETLGMAYDPTQDEIFCVLYASSGLKVYDGTTLALKRTWTNAVGGADGQLSSPSVSAWSADEARIYIQDWTNSVNVNKANRLQVFDRDGVWIRTVILNRTGGSAIQPNSLSVSTDGVLAINSSSQQPELFNRSTGALVRSFLTTLQSIVDERDNDTGYGSGFSGGGGVLLGSKCYLMKQIPSRVIRLATTTGAFEATMARGGARAGDMQRSTARLDNARGCLAIDGNGSYLLLPIDHHTQSAWTRIRLGTQRARWAKTFTAGTFPSGVTLKGVAVPGALGREQDATDDLRKARCYYSLDGGSTRTEFAPGQMNLAVAVASGATLTLDVDINTEAKPTQIPPWVGGAAGEGVSLVYDDPAATVYVDRPVSGISGSAAAVGSVTGAAVIIT